MQYSRMLDKRKKPTEKNIADTLGQEAYARLEALESFLDTHYDLTRETKFPFGNTYGWGYKYANGRKHLCYAFFEEGAFTVTIQIGDGGVAQMTALLPALSPTVQAYWENRYPCGENGGWMHIRVLDDATLDDVEKIIMVKVKPTKA